MPPMKKLGYYRVTGEASSVPVEDLPRYRQELQSLISQYNSEDVYNADETALYWKLEPSKSLARGPVSGIKKPKDRITIMLACNLTGTHKLPAVFINKYKNPRRILNIDKKTLPVLYYWNSSAWMQRSIFKYWIRQLDQEMRKKRRRILLLLDNASTHQLEDNEQLSNIKLHFLPPNTTAHLQPLDQGIIYSFKVVIYSCCVSYNYILKINLFIF